MLMVLGQQNSTLGTQETYFPGGLFAEDPATDESAATVVGAYLSAIAEPSLVAAVVGGELYRFLWMPPFDPTVIPSVA